VRSEHLPVRYTWICTACRRDWPCLTARNALLTEYADVPAALGMSLAILFLEAASDLEDVPAGKLYRRFGGGVPEVHRGLAT